MNPRKLCSDPDYLLLIRKFLWHLRHNIILHMFLDAPIQESKKSRKVFAKFNFFIMMLVCGLVVVFKTYPFTLSPPSYDSLNELSGTLVNISTKFGRRGGVQIKVKNDEGNIIKFPSGSASLIYSKSVSRKIKDVCIGSPVLVKWDEKKLDL